jgi:hypothetical protein
VLAAQCSAVRCDWGCGAVKCNTLHSCAARCTAELGNFLLRTAGCRVGTSQCSTVQFGAFARTAAWLCVCACTCEHVCVGACLCVRMREAAEVLTMRTGRLWQFAESPLKPASIPALALPRPLARLRPLPPPGPHPRSAPTPHPAHATACTAPGQLPRRSQSPPALRPPPIVGCRAHLRTPLGPPGPLALNVTISRQVFVSCPCRPGHQPAAAAPARAVESLSAGSGNPRRARADHQSTLTCPPSETLRDRRCRQPPAPGNLRPAGRGCTRKARTAVRGAGVFASACFRCSPEQNPNFSVLPATQARFSGYSQCTWVGRLMCTRAFATARLE